MEVTDGIMKDEESSISGIGPVSDEDIFKLKPAEKKTVSSYVTFPLCCVILHAMSCLEISFPPMIRLTGVARLL